MSAEPRGPTTEELRARVLAQSDTPAAILLERRCLACNREPGQRMCDLCTRLEIAEASAP